jgi:hypothetical protein
LRATPGGRDNLGVAFGQPSRSVEIERPPDNQEPHAFGLGAFVPLAPVPGLAAVRRRKPHSLRRIADLSRRNRGHPRSRVFTGFDRGLANGQLSVVRGPCRPEGTFRSTRSVCHPRNRVSPQWPYSHPSQGSHAGRIHGGIEDGLHTGRIRFIKSRERKHKGFRAGQPPSSTSTNN